MSEQVNRYPQPAQPGDNTWWKDRGLANKTADAQANTYTVENGPTSRSDGGRILAVVFAVGTAIAGCGVLIGVLDHVEKSGGF